MAVLIGCGDGLHTCGASAERIPCPLECVSLLACAPGRLAAADVPARLLWDGRRVMSIDGGTEKLLWWNRHLLVLSGETDSLTLLDGQTGYPVTLAPAGVYPQDVCLLPQGDTAAVCGGADGMIRLMALPSLEVLRTFRVPGVAARIAWADGALHVLCTVEDGMLRCLVCRIPLKSGRCEPAATLDGLPGAIAPDGRGGMWVGAGEKLYHLPYRGATPDVTVGGFGLIGSLQRTERGLIIADPVGDGAYRLNHGRLTLLRSGGVLCCAEA